MWRFVIKMHSIESRYVIASENFHLELYVWSFHPRIFTGEGVVCVCVGGGGGNYGVKSHIQWKDHQITHKTNKRNKPAHNCEHSFLEFQVCVCVCARAIMGMLRIRVWERERVVSCTISASHQSYLLKSITNALQAETTFPINLLYRLRTPYQQPG